MKAERLGSGQPETVQPTSVSNSEQLRLARNLRPTRPYFFFGGRVLVNEIALSIQASS